MRQLAGVVSFLTVIPAGGGTIEGTARAIHLFPLVGLIVGAVAGAIGWGASLYTDPLIVGVLVAGGLAVVTGMHHLDGLADFADGLMAGGSPKRRIAAMRDKSVGAGGVSSVVICVALVVAAASQRSGVELLLAVVLAEVAAKYSMVVAAYLGRPAAEGTGSVFCGAADKRRLGAATALWLAPVLALGAFPAVLAVAAAAGAAAMVVGVSSRAFGGITGDVLGAVNEIGRAAALVVAVSI